jgi:molybdate transport system regulatory protein
LARIRFGIYLGDDGPKLGHGKVALLKAIREHGSISAAARSMRMSYRHAWLMLDELNAAFEEPVIESSVGGAQRGGASLTDWGEELIARFEEMEQAATASLDGHLDLLDARLAGDDPPGSNAPPRRRSRGRS